MEAMEGIEGEHEVEEDVLRDDVGMDEIDSKSSSSTSIYPANDETFSSVKDASSLSPSPLLENSPMVRKSFLMSYGTVITR